MTTCIGVVGAGAMGSLHARVVATTDSTELLWVADPNQAAGEQVAKRYGCTWIPMPDIGSVDAVIIASPTQFHHALALEVIAAGIPVLVEKPLAPTMAQAEAIVAASQQSGSVLMCGLLERFNPAVRTAAEIAKAPLHISTIRHSPYSERIRTGVASDLLIHDVDLVIRLMKEQPSAISGHYGYFEPRSAPGSEDVAVATLRFSAGQISNSSVSRIAQHKIRSLTITELGRLIEVDLLRQSITIYRHVHESGFDEDIGYRQQTIIDIPIVRYPGEPLQLQLQRFLDLIAGKVDPAEERDTLLAPHRVVFEVALAAEALAGR